MRNLGIRRYLLAVTAVATLAAGLPSSAMAADGDPPWLSLINEIRTSNGLLPVASEPAWSADIAAHLTYLRLTPAEFFTGEYANRHTENPASPYYTAAGDAAGRASNLAYGSASELDAVERWLAAPFHAIGMLRPNLQRIGLYRDPINGSTGQNVIRGLGPSPATRTAVLFPGPGTTTKLVAFRGESPNPLEPCGYTSAGLPLIAMLTTPPTADLRAELTLPSGQTVTGPGAELCVITANTWRSSDAVYGPTGASILRGDNAVFIIPPRALTAGQHGIRLRQGGQPDVAWSFTASPSTASPAPPPPPPPPTGTSPEILRLAGPDRYGTAVAISRDGWAAGQAQAVVLARGDAFPDALAGTPLAAAKRGPLLLSPPSSLGQSVVDELRRVLPTGRTVYLLGGSAAMSDVVVRRIADLGYQPVRLAGADRYATATVISRQISNPAAIFEATGMSFPAALVAGVAAAKLGGVVVLTADGKMPTATKVYVAERPSVARIAVGREAAAADPSARSIVGADDYQTSRLLAEAFFDRPSTVSIASGTVFADALAGGAHTAKTGGPLLLSEPTTLPTVVQGYLRATAPSISRGYLYGGTAALSVNVSASVVAGLTPG